MASTNKTPQLGLNQWAAGDPVLREDFNGDNAKLEGAMGLVMDNPVIGFFMGNETQGREIVLGFKPKFVILSLAYGTCSNLMLMADKWSGFIGGSTETSSIAHITDLGFLVDKRAGVNFSNSPHHYAAFR